MVEHRRVNPEVHGGFVVCASMAFVLACGLDYVEGGFESLICKFFCGGGENFVCLIEQ